MALRALFSASAIGLGHAARAIALAEDLRRELSVEPFFLAGGPAIDLVAASGFDVQVMEPAPPFEVERGGLVRVGTWYRRYFSYYRSVRRWLREEVPWKDFAFALCDGDAPTAAVAKENALPVVFVAHRLRQDFAHSFGARVLEGIANRAYRRFAARMDLVLALEEPDGGNVRHLLPIARTPSRSREQLREDFSFRKKTVLVTAGGSNLGGFLIEAATKAALGLKRSDIQVVVSTGPSLKLPPGLPVFNYGFTANQHDLIAAADLVVSLAGKGTIGQALSSGTPIIAIPIRGHEEQERNAAALGYRHADLSRLREILETKLAEPRPPPAQMGNAAAVLHIQELLVRRGLLSRSSAATIPPSRSG